MNYDELFWDQIHGEYEGIVLWDLTFKKNLQDQRRKSFKGCWSYFTSGSTFFTHEGEHLRSNCMFMVKSLHQILVVREGTLSTSFDLDS